MKLRFHAVGHAHVPERQHDGSAMPRPAPGTPFRFVGRRHDPNDPGDKYPATTEPYECDHDTGEALYLAREVRDGTLRPADAETARACGVEFEDAAESAKDGN